MGDEPTRTRAKRALQRAGQWRARSNRQVWVMVVLVAVAICADAFAIPAQRHDVLGYLIGLICVGWLAAESRRLRQERLALSARLATLTSDDLPADVVSLVAAGKRIQAIKRYRDLTGVDLKEAKATIDSL